MFTAQAGRYVPFYNSFEWLYLLFVRTYTDSVRPYTVKKQSEPFAETTVAQIIKCLVCLSLSANACGENLPFFYDVEMHCFHFLCPFLVLSIYGVIICV